MREAYLYERSEWGEVRCNLCRHYCKIDDGKRGICRVRINRGGVLYTQLYEKLIVACPDPIQFLPLFHVSPGSKAFHVSALGLNFRRSAVHQFSAWEICRDAFPLVEVDCAPSDIVAQALQSGCRSIAYTHTEPTIFYELARDTMEAARRAGLLNVFLTNGYMTPDTLEDAKGLMDAVNVDLWSMHSEFYEDYLEAALEGVLDTLCRIKQLGIWLEVTTVLIPRVNDDPGGIRRMASFVAKELGTETPWHIARHVPRHSRAGVAATDLDDLDRARQIGLAEGLHHVYIRNTPGTDVNATHCPGCSILLIERKGREITKFNLVDGVCPSCGSRLEGIEISRMM